MRFLLVLALLVPRSAFAAAQPSLETISFDAVRSMPSPAAPAGVLSLSANLTVRVRHASISSMDAAAAAARSAKDYQLGDEWGKKPVTAASAAAAGPVFERAAKATARYGGATAFYLGFFNGHHLMATNHHVAEGMGCGARADFPLLGKSFPCERIYGDWKEIDLAVFSIRVAPGDEAALSGVGGNFAFDAAIYPGQRLLTIGFGVAGNPGRVMMASRDSDCRTFSGRGDFRKMADPDDFNPGPDKVWSFANGCDISHGDSGSAYVDLETGEVVGIVWTGRIPKSPQVGSSRYLAEMQRAQGAEIWTELSYTVPAARIRDGLEASLASGSLSADAAATIKAVLGSGSGAVFAAR